MECNEAPDTTTVPQVQATAFRVVFWTRSEPVGGFEPGMLAEAWRITDVSDVTEVLTWAEANARPGASVTTYCEIVDDSGLCTLIRVFGTDPTEGSAFVLRSSRR